MNSLGTIIRRESPLTLVREAIWRTKKRWKQARLASDLDAADQLEFVPAGYYRPTLDLISASARSAILSYADCICRGSFPWFGYGVVTLGMPPRWNLDFVSGKEWPQTPAEDLIVVRHDGSDVKVPWELSRLQFLPVLGKAWLLTGEDRYRTTAKNLLGDWIANNPVGIGVNWTIAMEVALRSISVCFLLELLWPFAPPESGWLRRVAHSLGEHLLYIEAHNEFSHFARSNHYLSNLVGLLTLSCFLQGEAMAVRRRKYARLVAKELFHQTYPDGGDFEASLGYHVLVLQMFTTALLLMRARRMSPGAGYVERVQQMFSLLSAVADDDGRVPHVGDCDDGRVEILTDDLHQFSDAIGERDSLRMGGFLGVGSALVRSPGDFQGDDAAWYGLPPGQKSDGRPEPGPLVCFPGSGIAVVRKSTAQVIFLATPNGIHGRGSHTHNDKLSLIVRLGGLDLLTDSGTSGYTRSWQTRNQFRSTRAHNTVMVDGEEQNRISLQASDLFRIADDAAVTPIAAVTVDRTVTLKASHCGYKRIGITHSRSLSISDDHLIAVADELDGTGTHTLELFFHLPVSWQVQTFRQDEAGLVCDVCGPRTVTFSWRASFALEGEQYSASISRAYGSTGGGTCIRVHGRAQLPTQITTHIRWVV